MNGDVPNSRPPRLPGAARARRGTPTTAAPDHEPQQASTGSSVSPITAPPPLRYNRDALDPAASPARHASGPAPLHQLHAAASATVVHPPQAAHASWLMRRSDDKGRIAVPEIAAAGGAVFTVTVHPGMLLLSPAASDASRAGTARMTGTRLCVPATQRRRAGIDAPSDIIVAPGPDGTWAVIAASCLDAVFAPLIAAAAAPTIHAADVVALDTHRTGRIA